MAQRKFQLQSYCTTNLTQNIYWERRKRVGCLCSGEKQWGTEQETGLYRVSWERNFLGWRFSGWRYYAQRLVVFCAQGLVGFCAQVLVGLGRFSNPEVGSSLLPYTV